MLTPTMIINSRKIETSNSTSVNARVSEIRRRTGLMDVMTFLLLGVDVAGVCGNIHRRSRERGGSDGIIKPSANDIRFCVGDADDVVTGRSRVVVVTRVHVEICSWGKLPSICDSIN